MGACQKVLLMPFSLFLPTVPKFYTSSNFRPYHPMKALSPTTPGRWGSLPLPDAFSTGCLSHSFVPKHRCPELVGNLPCVHGPSLVQQLLSFLKGGSEYESFSKPCRGPGAESVSVKCLLVNQDRPSHPAHADPFSPLPPTSLLLSNNPSKSFTGLVLVHPPAQGFSENVHTHSNLSGGHPGCVCCWWQLFLTMERC